MRFGLIVVFVFWISSLVMAGNIAQQVITYRIDAVNEISINGGPNSLVIAGDKDLQKSVRSVSWAITTNETNKRVVGSLDADMPSGLTLFAKLEAPAGSFSSGSVVLSTTPRDLLTGISRVAEDNLKMTYTLTAETDTSVVQLQRVLTLILTDGF
jgi:hypothetical protein